MHRTSYSACATATRERNAAGGSSPSALACESASAHHERSSRTIASAFVVAGLTGVAANELYRELTSGGESVSDSAGEDGAEDGAQ